MTDQAPTCVYIASRGHSGSTLLETLLGRCPDVASAGELNFLGLQCYRDEQAKWVGKCSCGMRPFECEVWGTVIDNIEQKFNVNLRRDPFGFRVSDVDLEQEYREKAMLKVPLQTVRNYLWRFLRYQQYSGIPGFKNLLRLAWAPQKEWVRNRTFVIRSLAEIAGVPVVVDSSKDHLAMRDLIEYADIPIRVLFLTRDCRGNVWSMLKGQQARAGRRQLMTEAAEDWLTVNSRIFSHLHDLPRATWMQVKYEDLCRDPETTMQQVCEFIGISYSASVLSADSHRQHTIAGNRMRFTNTQLKIREDNAWCQHLSPTDLDAISRIVSDFAPRLGYDI